MVTTLGLRIPSRFSMARYKRYVFILNYPKAIDFFLEYIQPNQVHCRKIILEAFSRFKSIFGTNAISQDLIGLGKWYLTLPKDTPTDLKEILWNEHKIEIPIFEWNGDYYIRSSFQVYNEKKGFRFFNECIGIYFLNLSKNMIKYLITLQILFSTHSGAAYTVVYKDR